MSLTIILASSTLITYVARRTGMVYSAVLTATTQVSSTAWNCLMPYKVSAFLFLPNWSPNSWKGLPHHQLLDKQLRRVRGLVLIGSCWLVWQSSIILRHSGGESFCCWIWFEMEADVVKIDLTLKIQDSSLLPTTTMWVETNGQSFSLADYSFLSA